MTIINAKIIRTLDENQPRMKSKHGLVRKSYSTMNHLCAVNQLIEEEKASSISHANRKE